MIIIHSIKHLQELTEIVRKKDKTIGFVPTMGALHQGHLSLVKTSMQQCDYTIVSIFVNPTQFENSSDFKNYPRTQEADTALLYEVGVDFVFIPSEKEIYPTPGIRTFRFGKIGAIMEGAYRPGHFNGVAQVVSRLFDIVQPDMAFFGEKDYQQLVIIKQLVKQMDLPVEIESCPIVRESDGLAMSSRNRLLTTEQRAHAPLIARTLFEAGDKIKKMSINTLKEWVAQTIDADPYLKTEYVEVVNAVTLHPLKRPTEADIMQLCVAVYADPIRLIDNIRLDKICKSKY
ncbi:MAG: pantoate--beta-alanine ligase [Prevotellaceae bacterium]|jgi:pantoate--beta-alanine ligase|nr:pantoate--beta-alanine ligase [Prevotellaceae bacterium]